MNKTYSKNEIKQLKKQLMCERKGIWPQMTDDERKEAMDYAVDYIRFLSEVKTEREAVRFISEMAIKNGFESITSSKAGTKILWQINGKVAALIHLGKQDLLSGFHLIASHIDAPRLDLKQNPLYEELDMAYLKTHYYGGIKKFQWLARPLAIHGVVLTHTGKTIEVVLGEQPSDPVFAINDLLPHLAGKVQADKKTLRGNTCREAQCHLWRPAHFRTRGHERGGKVASPTDIAPTIWHHRRGFHQCRD